MITARVEEIDRLLGLELGADDYICKPFSPREVVARVKAVLKRASAGPADKPLVVGEIRLIPETHQVLVRGHELRLTPCEYNLLKALLTRPNRIFSRNELINAVQGYDFEGYDRTIDSHVKNLPKKIARHLPGQEVVSTIYGVGYKLVEAGRQFCSSDPNSEDAGEEQGGDQSCHGYPVVTEDGEVMAVQIADHPFDRKHGKNKG
jgi:two-component system response regulator BaeR